MSTGENTSFYHQWHSLLQSGHHHPNPWRQILDNLKSIILNAISEETDVCMAINANKSLDTSNQPFQEWIVECSLISAHENLYDEEYYDTNKIPTTHQWQHEN
jgi:hypothetical protein